MPLIHFLLENFIILIFLFHFPSSLRLIPVPLIYFFLGNFFFVKISLFLLRIHIFFGPIPAATAKGIDDAASLRRLGLEGWLLVRERTV